MEEWMGVDDGLDLSVWGDGSVGGGGYRSARV